MESIQPNLYMRLEIIPYLRYDYLLEGVRYPLSQKLLCAVDI